MNGIKDFLSICFNYISAKDIWDPDKNPILNAKTAICYNNLNNDKILNLMDVHLKDYSRNELRGQLYYFEDIWFVIGRRKRNGRNYKRIIFTKEKI